MILVVIAFIIVGTICAIINEIVLLLLISNFYSILMALFSINYILYYYWYKLINIKMKEKIDDLVMTLNMKYRDNNIAFINKGLQIEVKSIEKPSDC